MTPVLFVASFYGPKKMLSQRICSLNILSATLLSALIFILPSVAVSQPSQYFVSASKGNDKNKDKKVIGSQYCKKLVFFDKIDGYSTTKILSHG